MGSSAMSSGSSAAALRVLAVLLGVFILSMGIDKRAWLTDSGMLLGLLQEWSTSAGAINRWYLETIAIPGAPVFARLVLFGELAAGLALICGFRVRLTATLTLLMVLNFHYASDVIFHYSYFINAYGFPVMGGLLALALGGKRLPLSLSG